jgi:hypothetical protein
MIFTRHAVETKSDVRHCGTVFLERGPDAVEVPAVCDEARSQTRIADGAQRFGEVWMQCRFAAGEVNAADTGNIARIGDHAAQQFEWKKLCVRAVEILVRA